MDCINFNNSENSLIGHDWDVIDYDEAMPENDEEFVEDLKAYKLSSYEVYGIEDNWYLVEPFAEDLDDLEGFELSGTTTTVYSSPFFASVIFSVHESLNSLSRVFR